MKTKLKVSDQAARLKKIRLYLGLTRQQLSKATSISQFTIRSWENGAKSFTEDGVERVISALNKKLSFSCEFEWLMYGVGASPISLYEAGEQDAKSIKIDSAHDRLLKEVMLFKKLNKKVDVIVVSDDKFIPLAEVGDYVGILPVDLSKVDNSINNVVLLIKNADKYEFGILKKENKKPFFFVLHFNGEKSPACSKSDIKKIYQLVWLRKNY